MQSDTDKCQCNGGRPCSNCVARGLECASSGPSAGFRFVPQQQQQASSLPRVLVQDSWKYISTYFQSVGYLTQASVMRSAGVTALSHRDENVSRTLSIMGGLYACQNPQVLRVSQKEKRALLGTWVKQKALMAMELKKPNSSPFSSVLLSTLLLAVIELVLCAEDGAFKKWLQRISSYVAQHTRVNGYAGFTTFERSLIQFFNFLNILSAIAANEAPLERRTEPEVSIGRPLAPKIISDDAKIDDMISFLNQWARLQSRMVEWTLKSESRANAWPSEGDNRREAINLKVQGLDIICEASTLQARVISNLLQLSQDPDSQVSVCITPYYHWALTGLSYRLNHESWKSLLCELPVLPAEALHQQALVALGCVETLTSQSGFDVALYLPLAEFIGREMGTSTEQTRMLAFLDIVKGRGFGLADEYRKDLLEVWRAASRPSPDEVSRALLKF
ncbi:hypothetical protein CORC01_01122 [Colletotrichum orchidophilum]|uniref:Zn(2)-C6 fungal-type domain-containing protein n=1 Tax=Colletotrichum orchidophilum TaxID=1209926 RepID=A0A1G4BQ07_9PEZI|nr:uncharacterized protein CORC01_01122 [Colletotrichum orchidophilum]OHF03403.1 hypothetical protein CORC01_01122 [Colletotrichum orchidophilum]